MVISDRIKNILPSKTLEIGNRVKLMKNQGIKIFALNSGESEFDTADHIKNKAIEAIKAGYTKYTEISGISELKFAIVKNILKTRNLHYSSDEVIVSNGAKQVLFNLFMSSLNPGDEVVLIQPCWNSYSEIVRIAGGYPIGLSTELKQNFQIIDECLYSVISDNTKWILLNSPNNPTGQILSEKSLKIIIDLMYKRTDINIVLDEVYDKIIFDSNYRFINILNLDPNLKERVLIVNAVSKSHAMTGWRVGYGLGSSTIIQSMRMIQSHSTANVSTIAQYAALEALSSSEEYIKQRVSSWREKMCLIQDSLREVNIDYVIPQGTFFIFPDFSRLIGCKYKTGLVIASDIDFANYLLETIKLSVVPGSVFGRANHLRLSCTLPIEELQDAMRALIDTISFLDSDIISL